MADFEPPAWRCKNKIGNIMSRLNKHANGEVEMTATQITAAKLYLDKTLPSLSSTQHSGDPEGTPIPVNLTVGWVSPKKPDDNTTA